MLLVLWHDRDRDEVRAALRQAVESGQISEMRLHASLRRILRAKHFIETRGVAPEPKNDVPRLIAEHSITLLRNRNGILPLSRKDAGRLYIGPAGSIEAAAGASRAIHPPTHPSADEVRRWSATAAQEASRATVVIAVAQNRPQVEVLRAARAANPRATFILISLGSPQLILDLPDVAAYVCAYGYLPPSHQAVARLLTGDSAPAGRLPVDVAPLFRAGDGLSAFR